MCGIVGYVGKGSFLENAKKGLFSLEYRGYDSAGVSYFDKDKLKVKKMVGNVENLFNNISIPKDVCCGIGHTRWATHGKVNKENAHPHSSYDNLYSMVHNGIIENYDELKTSTLKNIKFKTNVDSEAIVNLLALQNDICDEKSEMDILQDSVKRLEGSYAIAYLKKGHDGTIFFARKNSPLLVGKGENESFIASDIVGLGKNTKEYVVLPNNCYGYIQSDEICCYDFSGLEIELEFKNIPNTSLSAYLGNYKHFMEKEIEEVPTVIIKTAQQYLSKENPFENPNPSFWSGINKVEFVACGTSYHASKVGSMLIEDNAKIVCRSHIASEFVYNAPMIDSHTLCIFVSQSGETADTLHAVEVAKEKRAKTMAITNVETSNLATICDFVLPLVAGAEVAVASTKAYNAQVTVMYLLAEFLRGGNVEKIANELINISLSKLDMKKMWADSKVIAKAISDAKSIYFVGRHMDFITCLESSLKLKEISYIPCEAYAAGELKHGTIALVEEGTLIIAIVTEPKLLHKTENIVAQAKARGARVIYASNLTGLQDCNSTEYFDLPKVPTTYSPLFSIIPMQMLAYKVSVAKKYNPDRPRNLAKSVTVE